MTGLLLLLFGIAGVGVTSFLLTHAVERSRPQAVSILTSVSCT